MIRFIIKRRLHDAASGAREHCFETIDADVPALERAMRDNGCGPKGFNLPEMLGLEILNDPALENQHG